MSDSQRELRILDDGVVNRAYEHAHELHDAVGTPEDPEQLGEFHAEAAGVGGRGSEQRGGESGGSSPRGPLKDHSPAEIARRAAESAPAEVAYNRQFGAMVVGDHAAHAGAESPRAERREGTAGEPAEPNAAAAGRDVDR
jgi:hypothetical protein